MWTTENRTRYGRSKLRYPSGLTGGEWNRVKPFIPPAKHGGRKREVDVREVLNGIMYVLSTGCQWRALPKDFPPRAHPLLIESKAGSKLLFAVRLSGKTAHTFSGRTLKARCGLTSICGVMTARWSAFIMSCM